MADSNTTPAKPRKTAAPKTAAEVKTPAAPRPAAASVAPAEPKAPARAAAKKGPDHPAGTAIINIDKVKHGGAVRGAVNGQKFELPVGSDVTVTEAVLNNLRDSHVEFSTVSPLAGEDADEGSSASSTVTGTALRAEPVTDPAPRDEDGNPLPPPELRQITDKELTGGADQEASQEQAETADNPAE